MKINLVLAADDNYAKKCIVTIVSVLQNTKSFVDIYVLTSGFSEQSKELFRMKTAKYSCNVTYLKVDNTFLSDVPLPKELSHINIVTYYRLLMSILLPAKLDKVIYLDSDIIVRHDISQLFATDMCGYAVGSVLESIYEDRHDCKRLSIPSKYGYFNAGVLLVNLEFWRRNRLDVVFMDYLKKNHDVIVYHDQDVLNATLYAVKKTLPVTWNMLPILYLRKMNAKKEPALNSYLSNPSLVHFVYVPKPWSANCENPWKTEYRMLAESLGFYDLVPKDSFIFKVKIFVKKIFRMGYYTIGEL